jgi:transcription elongation factor SPT6
VEDRAARRKRRKKRKEREGDEELDEEDLDLIGVRQPREETTVRQ